MLVEDALTAVCVEEMGERGGEGGRDRAAGQGRCLGQAAGYHRGGRNMLGKQVYTRAGGLICEEGVRVKWMKGFKDHRDDVC